MSGSHDLKFPQKGPAPARNVALERPISKNGAEGFPFWQSHLATQLGVSEETLREARSALTEGVDWVKAGQRVSFSAGGVEKLRAALALVESSGELGVKGEELQPQKMRVVSKPVNPNLLVCVPADEQGMPVAGAARALVRVRSNVNFVPGMLLSATAEAGAGGVFSLVGACPRYRGRY